MPGDKSMTQRALILASLASGESRLGGLLHGGDADSTRVALVALGVDVPEIPAGGGEIRIPGVGLRGLVAPSGPLDLGNSGTGTRLLLGVLAGSGIRATLTGDGSLRSRPMRRVTDPLSSMGASFTYMEEDGRLPATVQGHHPLSPVKWTSPVASAQVKSAILLAGVTGGASAVVVEPRQSRDHTERMLSSVGAAVISHGTGGGWCVELRDPPSRLEPLDFDVPGDFSSAAFPLALAALGALGDADSLTIDNVGLNPTRTAFLDVLDRMGVRMNVEVDDARTGGVAEPVGSVTVWPGDLKGAEIEKHEIPRLIDELPLLAILGARAQGTTTVRGAEELRAKESDRIDAVVRNLRALGVGAEEHLDGFEVEGTARPLSGTVLTRGDHRIAMAFGVLGGLVGNQVEIDDRGAADVSFPGFWDLISRVSGGRGAR